MRGRHNENSTCRYTAEDDTVRDGSAHHQDRKYYNRSDIIKLHKDRFALSYYYSGYDSEDFMGFDPRPGSFENSNTTDMNRSLTRMLKASNTFELPRAGSTACTSTSATCSTAARPAGEPWPSKTPPPNPALIS